MTYNRKTYEEPKPDGNGAYEYAVIHAAGEAGTSHRLLKPCIVAHIIMSGKKPKMKRATIATGPCKTTDWIPITDEEIIEAIDWMGGLIERVKTTIEIQQRNPE